MPVVALFASDGTDDVPIADESCRWTVVLRNGGLDVLTTSRTVLELVGDLVQAHPKWSS